MIFFLDTEFAPSPSGNVLISMALIPMDMNIPERYWIMPEHTWLPHVTPWIEQNVIPHLFAAPVYKLLQSAVSLPHAIAAYLAPFKEDRTQIIADWPEDISLFCRHIQTVNVLEVDASPNVPAPLDNISMIFSRIESWPNMIPNAIQHNAYWDAMALRYALMDGLLNVAND